VPASAAQVPVADVPRLPLCGQASMLGLLFSTDPLDHIVPGSAAVHRTSRSRHAVERKRQDGKAHPGRGQQWLGNWKPRWKWCWNVLLATHDIPLLSHGNGAATRYGERAASDAGPVATVHAQSATQLSKLVVAPDRPRHARTFAFLCAKDSARFLPFVAKRTRWKI